MGTHANIVANQAMIRHAFNHDEAFYRHRVGSALGYWNQEPLTAGTFANRLSEDIQPPYLRTGDLGFIHQGELYATGRIKDLVIIRGKNYHPHDIEHNVSTAHHSQENSACAVIACRHKCRL